MSKTRHPVDPEIIAILEMPPLDLSHETLEEIRTNPLFSGADLPPPPCELHIYPGAIHAFEMLPDTTLAAQAAADLRRGLGRLLGRK